MQQLTTEEISASIQQSRPFFSGSMPLPPSIDDAYQVIKDYDENHRVRGSRIGPTPALDQFKHDAGLLLSQCYHDWSLINAIRSSKRHVPLAIELRVYFRTMWKSDLDNREKFAIDAVFERLDLNDNTVVDIHLVKDVDAVDPRVEIEVRCVLR